MNSRVLLILFVTLLNLNVLVASINLNYENKLYIAEQKASFLKDEIKCLEEKLNPKEEEPAEVILYEGKASWYGEADDECVGCRADRIMLNGDRLDDSQLTLALPQGNDLVMNVWLRVKNLDNNKYIYARYTDTGTFGDLGRVADLSKASKNMLECADLCNVAVYVPMAE